VERVEITVPASTANLGPGFDALGLALGLYNRIRLLPGGDCVEVAVSGEGAEHLSTGPDNLVYQAVQRLYQEVGWPAPMMRIELENAIPVSRGLGSSSTAIVGGLLGANALLDQPLSPDHVLSLAVEMEGHPDNVAPALLGGFQVTSVTDDGLIHLRLPTPAGLRAVVCIPDAAVSTDAARRVLPESYSRADAVFNVGRVALLVAALTTGEVSALRPAMQDKIHQPYRAELVPGFREALGAALDAGALGSCLSGSGSTMLALTEDREERIGEAMVAAVRETGHDARWLALPIDDDGATVRAI
jgi:homoserine kinase